MHKPPDHHPYAYLIHGTPDKPRAHQLATDLAQNGVAAFFDTWDIGPGDSIRQKIDAGLDRATHFLALLSSDSLKRPWVNAELDAAFMKKIAGRAKLIPLLDGVSTSQLTPLLQTLRCVDLANYDRALDEVLSGVFGLSERPALGPRPAWATMPHPTVPGFSLAAIQVAAALVKKSEHACLNDPAIDTEILQGVLGVPDEDLIDGARELEERGLVYLHAAMGDARFGFHEIGARPELFCEFDKQLMGWDPEQDALRVAAAVLEAKDSGLLLSDLAGQLDLTPRQLNPAVALLLAAAAVDASDENSPPPYIRRWLRATHLTRRFVRERG